MLNLKVLDAAITYAAEHPDDFYMQAWFKQTDCGTTACLAGTIALQDGWTPTRWSTKRVTGEPSNGESRTSMVVKDGTTDSTAHVAAQLLGLDDYRDSTLLADLFYAANLREVIAVRNAVAAANGLPERVWTVAR